MVAQLVMYGVPAYVSQTSGATQSQFYIDPTDYNPADLIAIDQARDSSVAPSSWATGVDVDVNTTAGYTTIGPTWNAGNHTGCAYISQAIWNAFPAGRAAWPPSPDALYQYTCVLRSPDGSTVTRYHGFKVQILSASFGTLAHVGFIPTGNASLPAGYRSAWVDLADASMCDPSTNGFTTITTSSATNTKGALFLTAAGMVSMSMAGPKIPKGLGL